MAKDRLETGRGRREGVVKAKSSGGKRWFYILLAALLIAGVGLLSYLSTRKPETVSQFDTTVAPIPNSGHAMGSESAPVEVVEFGDYECPACGSFSTVTEPDVKTRLVQTGQVRFRFMDFPLSGHRNTWPAHRAAWCAGDQGKFWEMHDAIYQNQDRWNGEATRRPDRVLSEIARGLGVTMEQYESCVSSGKFDPQIRANLEEGVKRGVGQTPTFFIGNKKIADVLSYDALKRFVDEARAQAQPARK